MKKLLVMMGAIVLFTSVPAFADFSGAMNCAANSTTEKNCEACLSQCNNDIWPADCRARIISYCIGRTRCYPTKDKATWESQPAWLEIMIEENEEAPEVNSCTETTESN